MSYDIWPLCIHRYNLDFLDTEFLKTLGQHLTDSDFVARWIDGGRTDEFTSEIKNLLLVLLQIRNNSALSLIRERVP